MLEASLAKTSLKCNLYRFFSFNINIIITRIYESILTNTTTKIVFYDAPSTMVPSKPS